MIGTTLDDLFLLHDFRINLDLDRIANHGLAGPEHLVVSQIEILAIDAGGCRDATARVAPRIRNLRRRPIDIERHFVRCPVDGEIANDLQFTGAARDLLGFEFDGWILFNVKKIGTLKIFIARLDSGVNGIDVNAGRYLRLRDVFVVQHDGPRHLGETTGDIRDPEMADGELSG